MHGRWRAILLTLILGACASAPAAPPAAPSNAPPAQADTAEACWARGCRWRMPLVCGGIKREFELRDDPKAYVCVCEAELLECMRRP